MLVELVAVATAGVGLPDLDQLAGHRHTGIVEDPPGHDDALADRLARMAGRQVSVEGVDVLVAEAWRPAFDLLGINNQQRLFRMAQGAAAVRRVVQARLGVVARPRARALVAGRDAGDLRRDVSLRRGALGVHEP